ncbi:MAG TPA: hypothetical protein PLX18_11485 [Anaerohalosphaeraceae bacterium]|nr:hypothetical protein [Anaerohalosphaeraceae bacterium]HQG06843.1 hypothetical protein [Anaerohalosphaeraceae bacterium]HQI08464.1 hypothetical protein [Anaerohalosphaeraceae bacterium]HQJ68783.1 hypothetical protein [Anaerohalosphaeraceae bacterium]
MDYKRVRPIFCGRNGEDLSGYSSLYLQIFSYDGTKVFDLTANGGEGGEVPVESAAYANTVIPVPYNSDLNVAFLQVPTTLRDGVYTWRLKGAANATPSPSDDLLGGGNLPWGKTGGEGGLTQGIGPLPMPLE